MLGLKNNLNMLVDYDPSWEGAFIEERRRIARVLDKVATPFLSEKFDNMHQMRSFRGIPTAPEYVVTGNARICRIIVAEAFQWVFAFRPIIKRANANKDIQDRFGSHAWNSG